MVTIRNNEFGFLDELHAEASHVRLKQMSPDCWRLILDMVDGQAVVTISGETEIEISVGVIEEYVSYYVGETAACLQ